MLVCEQCTGYGDTLLPDFYARMYAEPAVYHDHACVEHSARRTIDVNIDNVHGLW